MKMIHKPLMLLSVIGTLFLSSNASAVTRTVEDRALGALPHAVLAAVHKDRSFAAFNGLSCKLIGEKVPLSTTPSVSSYLLTTADACGWGAALGPIWLVDVDGEATSLVLTSGGYSVDVLDGVRKGMRDVKIGYGVATGSTFFVYGFDGKSYQKIHGATSK